MTTSQQRAEWTRLAEVASPGEWQYCQANGANCKCGMIWSIPVDIPVIAAIGARDENYTCGEGTTDEQTINNGHFTAAARTAVPELLAENEKLREILRRIVVGYHRWPLTREYEDACRAVRDAEEVLGK